MGGLKKYNSDRQCSFAALNQNARMPRPSQEGGPDTGVHEHLTASKSFRTVDLQQARSIFADEVPHLICLPLDCLWGSWPVDASDLKRTKQSLVQQGLLSDEQAWSPTFIRRENFNSRTTGFCETRVFQVFLHIFNGIMSSLASGDKPMPGCVDRMVHAGSIEPKSDRQSSHRPDAFLIAHSETSPKPTESETRWRDVTCPFEYKFGNGDATDVCHTFYCLLGVARLMVCRTTSKRCGAFTISCAVILVVSSLLESPYAGPHSPSGCCAVLPLSSSTLSTGSRSVPHANDFVRSA
jgi:hypothetical protein